jgi:hypothetical protein
MRENCMSGDNGGWHPVRGAFYPLGGQFSNPLGDIFFFQDDVNTFFVRLELEKIEDSGSESSTYSGSTIDPLNPNDHWIYEDNQIPDLAGPVERWEEVENILSQFTNPVDEETAQGAAIINSSGTTVSLNGKTIRGNDLIASIPSYAYRPGGFNTGNMASQLPVSTGNKTVSGPYATYGRSNGKSAQTREV